MKSKLTLVGAGPGAYDLITIRGLKALKEADVILYDALVNEEFLNEASPKTIKVFVGKRGGKTSWNQTKINQLIVSYAAVHRNVVRLKGGDPFIFGRGLEELEFAAKHGILVDVVPGISSATGLTALNKISLTQRDVADGFWVMTASKKGHIFNRDIELAARSNSTVVILMGVNKIHQIQEAFEQAGKIDTPALMIQNGSLVNEKLIFSKVSEMQRKAKINCLNAPAIIVIGETVKEQVQNGELNPYLTLLN